MPNYSVTITLPAGSKTQIEGKLRTAFGSAVAQEAQIAEATTPANRYDPCRVNGHFGCVHWTDDDLRGKLEELNIPVTTDIVASLKAGYALRHIDDCMVELGWGVIEQAILENHS